MELAARIGTMARRGAPLPYLRRVAYLESHGTEYINTMHKLSKVEIVYTDVSPVSRSVNGMVFWGAGKGDGSAGIGDHFSLVVAYGTNNSFQFVCTYPSANQTIPFEFLERYEVKCELSNGRMTIGDVIKTYACLIPEQSNFECYLFAKNDNGNVFRACSARIYSFEIVNGVESAMKLIPVLDLSGRPAMYDEVSGKLFYNQGSGEFSWGELET